ncbi:MAG: amidohydrolase [Lachnospiraceae bacterium]|nr:amidohydrolase [Lachnospiraceae bacterium]
MKRKLCALLFAGAVAVGMTACGGGKTAETPGTTTESQAEDDASEEGGTLTIITNGVVEQIEGDEEAGYTAVVLQDGKIVYVGDDEGALEYKTDDAELIDAGGNTIMPTMTEAHLHFYTGISAKYEIDLADIIAIEDMQDIIREFIETNPDLEEYVGTGWQVSSFDNGSPTKDILDEVCPDKPMMLQEVDGHAYWVNSKALEALGIDKEYAKEYNDNYIQNGGRIVVDAEGEPTGHLKEAAGNLVTPLKPVYSVEQIKEAMLEQQDWFASLGFTSFFDAGILNMGPETAENYYTAMSELAKEGKLNVRVHSSFWVQPYDFDNFEECKEYMDEWLVKAEELNETEYFKVNTIKMMADQVLEEGTAYMSEGMYADGVLKNDDIESNNIWSGKEDMLEKVIEYGGEHGLNIHIHEIGDAAATMALDAVEKAEEAYPELKDDRVSLVHCQFIDRDDFPRMKELGVSAIVAPYWAVIDDYYWSVYLPLMSSQEALDTQYPMESLEKAGINVAFHSDYVVTKPDMGWLFYSAQTRVLPQKMFDLWYGEDSDEFYRSTDTSISQKPEDNVDKILIGPLKQWDEALSLDETLQAATINGARTINLDDKIGSIMEGKSADIMILNMNLREAPIEEHENVAPIRTFFEGRTVFEAE